MCPVVRFKTTVNFNILNIPVHIFWTYISMKCVLFVFWWNMSLLSGCDGQLGNLRRVLAANQSWCANSPQKKQKYAMHTAQIYSVTVWKMQNTKYKVQYMKYNAQSHHMKSPIYNALIQYSTMCKSTREKKSQALATPPLLSLVNYPQFSIHLYSFCIPGTLHICTQYLYFQSICVLYSIICVWCLVFFTPVNCCSF